MAKWYFLILFFIFLVLPVGAVTTTIDFKERYRDWDNHVYDFNSINLEAHPLYVVADNGDNWGIVRDNKTVYLPKRSWIEYQFYPERIVPRYVINNFSQINTLVTKVNTSVWYLTIPFSANYYVSVTDDLIDFGVFKRTTKITVTDSNTTTCGLLENVSCPDYRVVPKVIDNNIRLYFNPQNFTNVVYPLFLTENTITIDNATFWVNQDCGEGYWSAYGGGSCATPLNATIHSNLSGYWDMESTIGYEHGINKYGRFPNSTIAGTFYGNPSINYTSGKNWGNAVIFDGINDYLNLGNNNTYNVSKISLFLNIRSGTQSGNYKTIIGRTQILNTLLWEFRTSTPTNYEFRIINTSSVINPFPFSNGTYYYTNFVYDNVNQRAFLDDTVVSTVASTQQMPSNISNVLTIGALSYPAIANYFNGTVDEVIIDSSGLPIYSNSTYATAWNMPFLNNTATAGSVIDAVKFNIYNINTQNNTVNISTRQTGNLTWVQIATDYVSDTWINQTFNISTDFAVNVSGNGSSRAFVISMTYDESPLPPEATHGLNGTINNSLGAPVEWALITWDNQTDFTNETGYYEFANATSGEHTLTAQHVGYETHTETFDLTMNMTKNITLSEKETVSEDTAIDYSIVGAMLGGLLAFVLLRRIKKDDR